MSATRFVTTDGYTYEFKGDGQMRATDEFGSVVEYERVAPATPTADALNAFTGRYVNDEVDATLTLNVENGTLVGRLRSTIKVPLS